MAPFECANTLETVSKSKKKKLKKKAKQQTLHEVLEKAEQDINNFQQEYCLSQFIQETGMIEGLSTRIAIPDLFKKTSDLFNDDTKVRVHVTVKEDDDEENDSDDDAKKNKKKKKKKKKKTLNFGPEDLELAREFDQFYPKPSVTMPSSSQYFDEWAAISDLPGKDELSYIEMLIKNGTEILAANRNECMDDLEQLPVYKLIERLERESQED